MRGFGAALALLALGAASAFAQSPVLPQSVVTNGEKIEWMRSEVTTISRRMSVEQTKPTAQQVEDVYVAAIVRLGDIDALSRSLYGVPDVDDAVRKYAREASMALDLARNARLGIGVPVDEIRTVKGKPRRITETITGSGKHELWEYQWSVLEIENGRLKSIRQVREQ